MRIIAGRLKGRQLTLPDSSTARPTADRTREALFSILMPVLSGARVLDLFAGSGALGAEALSRGASSCVFVELDPDNAAALRASLRRFGLSEEEASVVCADFRDVVPCLELEDRRFDLIFLDPPYRAGLYTEAAECALRLLTENGMIVIEHERGEPEPELPSELKRTDRRNYGKNVIDLLKREEGQS